MTYSNKRMFGEQLNIGHWSTDGLVFYWRGIPASNVVDESLYRNHGTLTGSPVWSGGYLTASGDVLATLATSLILAKGTIIFTANDADGTVCGDIGTTATQNFIWPRPLSSYLRMRDHNAGDIQFTVTNFTGEHQYAITWDNSGSTFGYQDGKALSIVAGGALGDPFHLTHLFAGYNAGDFDFNGGLKTFFVYDRALSVSEIQQLYISPDLPMQQRPVWMFYTTPSGVTIPVMTYHYKQAGGL